MQIDVLTLFPNIFTSFLSESIPSIAIELGKLNVNLIDIRDYAYNKHRIVDDYPFGGGAGMVMKPEPIYEALQSVYKRDARVIYFTPQGRLLDQKTVREYAQEDRMIFLCGHYKDIDQRIRDQYVTDEISIGDYVLSGGELAALVLIDAVARIQEGVLNDIESANTDSHEQGMLGVPQYTRPAEFQGMGVPEVLTSGNHKKIEEWRKNQAKEMTFLRRPDLMKK